jgi:hypothetical protein
MERSLLEEDLVNLAQKTQFRSQERVNVSLVVPELNRMLALTIASLAHLDFSHQMKDFVLLVQ